ncbi:putative odorant receptor 65b [Diachasma alloeum]|uniref:Odorant receptor n=1 Tax=Diachasma alloeum TaxID=454923 RepID=A0A4E0S3X5_9HYME|nr:putative odorant receptor 65b [Diachasma alloeum]THK33265.1 odorant receptor 126 [Diachasma alloeum]
MRFLYLIYKAIIYTIIMIFFSTLFAHLVLNYRDLLVATDDACYLAGISVIIFKLYNFNKQHRKIKDLIEEVYRPLDVLSQSSDMGLQTLLKTTLFYERMLLYFFIILAAFLVIALMVFVPKTDGELPIKTSFPFDTTISPGHEIAMCLQTAAITFGLYSIVAMDSLAINICRCLSIQLLTLASNYEKCIVHVHDRCRLKTCSSLRSPSKRLSVLKVSEEDLIICKFVPFRKEEEQEDGDSFVKRFNLCEINHQRIIVAIDEFNSIFSGCMLMQVFSSFSMICFAGFQAVLGASSKESVLKFIVYLGAAMSQLVNWCWSGNQLIYQSTSLFESQWQSGWEHQLDNHKVKTLMLMSMMRSKNPLQLRAGNYYSMSMHTLISILRNSYSFFALLRTVTEAV